MKYLGGLLVLGYAALHAMGMDRMPDDDRGELPSDIRRDRAGVLLWTTGFMGGK